MKRRSNTVAVGLRQALPTPIKDLLRPVAFGLAYLRSLAAWPFRLRVPVSRLAEGEEPLTPRPDDLVAVVGLVQAPPDEVFKRVADRGWLLGLTRLRRRGVMGSPELRPPRYVSTSLSLGSGTRAGLRVLLTPHRGDTTVQAMIRLESAGSVDRLLLALGGRAMLERRLLAAVEGLDRGPDAMSALVMRHIDRWSAPRWTTRVVAVYAAAFRQPPYNDGPRQVRAFRRRFEWYSKKPGFSMFIVREPHGRLAGFCAGREASADETDIAILLDQLPNDERRELERHDIFFGHEIGVHPDFRAVGVGKIMQAALFFWRPDQLALAVFRTEEPFLTEWYQRSGWQLVAPVKPQPSSPQHTLMKMPLPHVP